jgi:hypothetical protein
MNEPKYLPNASANFLGRNWKNLLKNESVKYMDRYNQVVLISKFILNQKLAYRKK